MGDAQQTKPPQMQVPIAWYQQIVNGSPNPIVVIDNQGNILAANKAFQEWALPADDLLGIPIAQFLALSDGSSLEVLEERVADGEVVSNIKLVLTRPNGQQRVLLSRVYAIRSDEGQVEGCVIAGTDITAHVASENELRTAKEMVDLFMKQAPLAIIRWDLNFRVLSWNLAAERIFGYSQAEAIGQHAYDIIVPEHLHEHVGEVWADLIEQQQGTDSLNENITKSGQTIMCDWHNMPLVDREGRVVEVVSLSLDITQATKTRAALQRSEERFRMLVQNSSDIIAVVDADAVLQYISPSIQNMLGYESATMIGKSSLDLVHPEDRRTARQFFNAALKAGSTLPPLEVRLLHADRRWIHTETTANNLIEDPNVQGLVLNTRDISERIAYEEGLIQAKEQAEVVAHLKNTLIHNMSHEIRTPLTAILGFAEVLTEELTDTQLEFARLIYNSGARLLATLNSVLDFARLESGEMQLEHVEVELGEMVQTSAQLYQQQAEQKGLVFIIDRPETPIWYNIDPNALHSIVGNLVSNAIKFTEQGQIYTEVFENIDEVGFTVSDTGRGIQKKFLPFIFDEFKQESDGLARQHGGSGLGLAITKRLVEEIGGRVEVESVAGAGSRFTVLLSRP